MIIFSAGKASRATRLFGLAMNDVPVSPVCRVCKNPGVPSGSGPRRNIAGGIERLPQGGLAEQDQFRQALLFYRSMPPLQIRIQIGTARWQFNCRDPDRLLDPSERRAEFCISIMQQIPAAIEKADVRYSAIKPVLDELGVLGLPGFVVLRHEESGRD